MAFQCPSGYVINIVVQEAHAFLAIVFSDVVKRQCLVLEILFDGLIIGVLIQHVLCQPERLVGRNACLFSIGDRAPDAVVGLLIATG